MQETHPHDAMVDGQWQSGLVLYNMDDDTLWGMYCMDQHRQGDGPVKAKCENVLHVLTQAPAPANQLLPESEHRLLKQRRTARVVSNQVWKLLKPWTPFIP
jgi:hypothetical protein